MKIMKKKLFSTLLKTFHGREETFYKKFQTTHPEISNDNILISITFYRTPKLRNRADATPTIGQCH